MRNYTPAGVEGASTEGHLLLARLCVYLSHCCLAELSLACSAAAP
jgi:hypothetical protein